MLNIWIQKNYGKERIRPVLPIIAKYLQSRIIGKIFFGVLVIKINAVEWGGLQVYCTGCKGHSISGNRHTFAQILAK